MSLIKPSQEYYLLHLQNAGVEIEYNNITNS